MNKKVKCVNLNPKHHWLFGVGVGYSKTSYTEEQAKKAYSTMTGCEYCLDCTHLTNCFECTNSHKCIDGALLKDCDNLKQKISYYKNKPAGQ